MHNENVTQRWGLKKNRPKHSTVGYISILKKRKDQIIIIIIKTNKRNQHCIYPSTDSKSRQISVQTTCIQPFTDTNPTVLSCVKLYYA